MSDPFASPLLLTRHECAELLRVSLGTVDRLLATGRLGLVRIGRVVRVPARDVERLASAVATMPAMDTTKHGKARGSGRAFLFHRRRRRTDGSVAEARCWSYTVSLPGGQPVTVHTQFSRKDLAAEAMRRHREELEAAAAGRKASPWAGLTLAEIVEKIIERGGLKGSASAEWLSNWRTTVMRGLEATGWTVPSDADEHSWVAAWNGEKLARYSSCYRNGIRAQMRSLLGRLVTEKIIDRNPLADAARDKRGDVRRKARAMTLAELGAVVERLPADVRDVVVLAYGAALRKADLRMLRVEWLAGVEAGGVQAGGGGGGGGGLIRVPDGQDKSRRASVLRLAPWAWAAAMRLAAGRAEGALIERPAKWWRKDLPAAWAAAAEGLAAGPKGHVLRLGSVRKTAITAACGAGGDVVAVRDFARHRDVQMTLGVYAAAGLSPAATVAMRLPELVVAGGGEGWTAGRTAGGGDVGGEEGAVAGANGAGGEGAEGEEMSGNGADLAKKQTGVVFATPVCRSDPKGIRTPVPRMRT